MLEIFAIGGYGEVGKNMTAVKIGDEVIIIDMGIFLPAIVNLEEEEKINISTRQLMEIGAIPDDSIIEKMKGQVKAIILGHVHLDHIASVPYLASKYDCPVIGTPFTIEVLKTMLEEEGTKIPNELRTINTNSMIKVSENIKIEFINITHSTLQTSLTAIHTSEGVVLYCNDFKFDNNPILGKKPNYKRLKQLSGKVKVLIVESLYADREGKTPSEKVAKELLKDVLLGVHNRGNAVFVTTFASHLARLKSILEFGRKLRRQVIFLGRSMVKYINAAEKIGLIKFSKHAKIFSFKNKVKRALTDVQRNPGKYLVVCTGSQGEPNSILDQVLRKKLPFEFLEGDHVIFSCRVIPTAINMTNREMLENMLKKNKVRIFTDVHSSGHASREDLRDLIKLVKAKHIIPAHADILKLNSLAELAVEQGYELGKDVHVLQNGQKIKIN